MTRFSRVTFNAAHKYLGLTTEVLRTEKAINDIACHPLPASFYESGAMNHLRQRFNEGPRPDDHDHPSDYFSVSSSSTTVSSTNSKTSSRRTLAQARDQSTPSMRPILQSHVSSRKLVQAGDLLSTTGNLSESYRPRPYSMFSTPRHPRQDLSLSSGSDTSHEEPRSVDDFDLKQEVMSCIAKSIGLIQPPAIGEESLESSPPFPSSDSGITSGSVFRSSFGSLSLFDMIDDTASSATGSSTAVTEYMSGLDNEVEIRFFPAGSILASAGERNTGQD
jgi:lysophospholipid hydrolase